MNSTEYQFEEVIPVGKANLLSFLLLIPIVLIAVIPFVILFGTSPLVSGFNTLQNNLLVVLAGLLVLIVIHEGLHGITWAFFAKTGLKSISFGIKWAYLTPYCHCNEPLKRKQYILGGIMPGLVTGIIPLIVSYINANGWLLLVSVFLIATAGGDFLVLFRTLKYPSTYIFFDHPTEIGFIANKNHSVS
ncbi:MAG: hypothetical protein PWR03_398 [Tenuifilum sp.]|jgi:hypothetical protein|uniref:DUF3267 domain-containing protein n=1 Tax=Tenuifilum sp. TaxID=2760880 RepID=UPI0024AA7B8F|nr:DUF3267 domain-containing protein [Tenuifilum sp.]MDI3526215.1 hypothetical protein [Tenuifilum sp.]